MEDVKELKDFILTQKNMFVVSILVLMEDVKEHDISHAEFVRIEDSFNPCFNGRCKRTKF